MKTIKYLVLASATILSATSYATITITPGPGNFSGDENVLYNGSGLLDNGFLVQGRTNQTSTIVDFFDAGEILVTPSGGQSRIEAADGGLTDLTVRLHNPSTFQTLIWNLDAVANGDVAFTVQRTGGLPSVQNFSLGQNGQNFFRFQATGEAMIQVHLHSSVNIADVKQVRIGGISNVPEPATMSVIAAALGLLFARRRKTR